MITLGLDFDNTLIEYDDLFKKLAVENNLIPESFNASKLEIRDYLRNKGLDSQFTRLQGLAYGPRILEAKPAKFMIETIQQIIKSKIRVLIISHKTIYPYFGPKYHLREYALEWMKEQKFFSPAGLNLRRSAIKFNSTKTEKVNYIIDQKCNYFVDDLTEILNLLPKQIKGIHYSPKVSNLNSKFQLLSNWKDLLSIIEKS